MNKTFGQFSKLIKINNLHEFVYVLYHKKKKLETMNDTEICPSSVHLYDNFATDISSCSNYFQKESMSKSGKYSLK